MRISPSKKDQKRRIFILKEVYYSLASNRKAAKISQKIDEGLDLKQA